MKIQVLGPGCPKCKALAANAEQAVADSGLNATVVKVTDINEILDFGVMMTPALAVDGVVKSVGKVLTPAQVREYLE